MKPSDVMQILSLTLLTAAGAVALTCIELRAITPQSIFPLVLLGALSGVGSLVARASGE